MAALDFIRSRVLSGLGEWLERRLGAATLERSLDSVLAGRNERADALRDLEALRGFFSGGVTFLFDAPWVPVYIAVIYLLHPILGHMAVAAAVVLFALALANNALTAKPLAAAGTAGRRAMRTADAALRNAEAVEAMDLMPGIIRRWEQDHDEAAGQPGVGRAHRRPAAQHHQVPAPDGPDRAFWRWAPGWSSGTNSPAAP